MRPIQVLLSTGCVGLVSLWLGVDAAAQSLTPSVSFSSGPVNQVIIESEGARRVECRHRVLGDRVHWTLEAFADGTPAWPRPDRMSRLELDVALDHLPLGLGPTDRLEQRHGNAELVRRVGEDRVEAHAFGHRLAVRRGDHGGRRVLLGHRGVVVAEVASVAGGAGGEGSEGEGES